MSALKLYTCTDFEGHWAVPVAAIVLADDAHQAAGILQEKLADAGLPQSVAAKQMSEIPLTGAGATILSDGEY